MRELRLRLEDILEAIGKIEEAHARGREVFDEDEYVQVWMSHHIRNIGEAVRSVSDELKALRPDVPWAQIVAMRHMLVHHYFGVELDAVWRVVENDIPDLRAVVEGLISGLSVAESAETAVGPPPDPSPPC